MHEQVPSYGSPANPDPSSNSPLAAELEPEIETDADLLAEAQQILEENREQLDLLLSPVRKTRPEVILKQKEKIALLEKIVEALELRMKGVPQNRSDCENDPEPCARLACKYHLVHTIDEGSERPFWKMRSTCALAPRPDGNLSWDGIGVSLGLSGETIRQNEGDAKLNVLITFLERFHGDSKVAIVLGADYKKKLGRALAALQAYRRVKASQRKDEDFQAIIDQHPIIGQVFEHFFKGHPSPNREDGLPNHDEK